MNTRAVKKASSVVLVVGLLFFQFFANFPVRESRADIEDVSPPQLIEFAFDKETINTEDGEDTQTLTVRLTDDITGVGGTPQCRVNPASNDYLTYDFVFELISGDKMDGIYGDTVTFPQFIANGEWVVRYCFFEDAIGNQVFLYLEDLESIFGENTARFTNVSTVVDTTAPELTAFEVLEAYREVNTEEEDQQVKIAFTLVDDMAGGSVEDLPWVIIESPIVPGRDQSRVRQFMIELTGEDELEQTYEGTATLARGIMNGVWKIKFVYLWDKVKNSRDYSTDDLTQEFGAAAVSVNNIAATFDASPPQITSFSITPTEFNTSQGGVELEITMRLTDNMSGVNTTGEGPDYSGSPTQVRIRPLIGTQLRDFIDLTLVEGNDLDGTYSATLTLPQYSKVGIWQVENIYLVDKLGNDRFIDTDELLEIVPDAEGITLVNTATADEVVIEREWTISSEKVSVTFPKNTTVTKEQGGSFAFYRMVGQGYAVEEYESFSGLVEEINTEIDEDLAECQEGEECIESEVTTEEVVGDPVGAVKVGIPGLNLQFDKPVTVSLKVDSLYNGWRLLIQSFEEGGEAWANEGTCLVSSGTCTFTVNHASFFIANRRQDTKAPTGSIQTNKNANQTYSRYVTLTLSATDSISGVRYMRFSNNGKNWTKWLSYKTSYKNWNIISKTYGGNSKEGTKRVRVQYRDRAGNRSKVYSNWIIYNPRKVTPVVVYRYWIKGKSPYEYVSIVNRLRGNIEMSGWLVGNSQGYKRTMPKTTLKEGYTLMIRAGKGTNTSWRVYLNYSSSKGMWKDSGDYFKLYTSKNKLLYSRRLY